MLSFYRSLLYLYPRVYRQEYAEEMFSVFREARADVGTESTKERIIFRVRETSGLLAGALRERICAITGNYRLISFRGFDMRPQFRFPRSTVFLMAIILGGVIVAMEKAHTIEMKYAAGVGSIWPSLPWFLGFTLLVTGAAAVAIWGILFALGRSGAHRLANIQADPPRIR